VNVTTVVEALREAIVRDLGATGDSLAPADA